MIKSLRESKAKLSELVERASGGEDVLISVRGKVRARLTAVPAAHSPSSAAGWVRELRALHSAYSTGWRNTTTDQVLEDDRQSRG